MDKKGKIKIYLGFLIFVILSSSVYIMLPENVKISVEKTRTKLFVWENKWVLGATEYITIWDGSTKMRRKYDSTFQAIICTIPLTPASYCGITYIISNDTLQL